MSTRFNFDFNHYWSLYEKKVKDTFQKLDLKGQLARKVGEARLNDLSKQIKKTQGVVERRVKVLVDAEAKKLNTAINQAYDYVVKLAKREKAKPEKKSTAKKPAKRKAAKSRRAK